MTTTTTTAAPDQAFSGRPMECAHCGHTIDEHESIDECAECERTGAEFTCRDFDW